MQRTFPVTVVILLSESGEERKQHSGKHKKCPSEVLVHFSRNLSNQLPLLSGTHSKAELIQKQKNIYIYTHTHQVQKFRNNHFLGPLSLPYSMIAMKPNRLFKSPHLPQKETDYDPIIRIHLVQQMQCPVPIPSRQVSAGAQLGHLSST